MRAATAAGGTRRGPAWARARGRERRPGPHRRPAGGRAVAAHPGRPAGRLPQPAPVLGRPVRRRPLLRGQGGADVPGGAALPGRGHRVPAGQRALHHPARPGGRHRRRLPARLRLRDAAGRRRRAVGRDPPGPGRRRRPPPHPPGLRAGHGGRRGRCCCSASTSCRRSACCWRRPWPPRAGSAGRRPPSATAPRPRSSPACWPRCWSWGWCRRSGGGGRSSGRCRRSWPGSA